MAATHFLKLANDIIGDSREPAHMGWIEALSLSTDIQPTRTISRAAPPPSHWIGITKRVDRASAALMNAIANATLFDWAILDVPSANFYLAMRVVLLDGYHVGGRHGQSEPLETVGLACSSIEYKPGKAPARLAAMTLGSEGGTRLALAVLRRLNEA
jgi:type VI protein secretion system component Hcp